MFHTPTTFLKFGWRQPSTWIGIALLIIFGALFYSDLHTLIHKVLTSDSLAEKIVTGLSGAGLILFNRSKSNNGDKDKPNDNNVSNQ